MNTLRKLVDRWRAEWVDEDSGETNYNVTEVTDCADELSAEIPKWERVARAADDFLGAPAGTQAYAVAADELRAALSEVRHD